MPATKRMIGNGGGSVCSTTEGHKVTTLYTPIGVFTASLSKGSVATKTRRIVHSCLLLGAVVIITAVQAILRLS